ncbi:hypothetical protein FOA43_001567 [Brettanomyces nanus]|uniref:Uncharacterized protein n=1 Tax=Eeniella nana TaxID=13502 RepID=A0A875S2D2_EENNA|nr:uncharacterized protein FOA43_001567 [Brettanomyces nanus]QPG74242.1 hypothetical protein FOA43_001567 [Brettanomyces nanus]
MPTIDQLIDQLGILTQRSEQQLNSNEQISSQLHTLQSQIIDREYTIEELAAKHENSQIFLQHLASLSLRCDFLDKQLTGLEGSSHTDTSISATCNLGLKEFKDWKENSLNWMTAETTYENLSLEYNYLIKQLNIANKRYEGYRNGDNVINSEDASDLPASTSATDISTDSLFSSKQTSLVTNSSSSFSEVLPRAPKRRLLKMESFLSIPYEQEGIYQIKSDDSSRPLLKQFRIPSIVLENNERAAAANGAPLKLREASNLPVLHESEYEESFQSRCHLKHHISLPETVNVPETMCTAESTLKTIDIEEKDTDNSTKPGKTSDLSWFFDHLDAKSQPCMPKETLRHFVSYDTGLKRSSSKHFNFNDFSFIGDVDLTNDTTELRYDKSSVIDSSQSITTVKHSHIDEEAVGMTASSMNSDDSYGHEEVLPVDFLSPQSQSSSLGETQIYENIDTYIANLKKKDIERKLHKSRSHDSIFNDYGKNDRGRVSHLRNTDLKAQTLKWLKPCVPIVSPSDASFQRPVVEKSEPVITVSSSFRKLKLETNPINTTAATSAFPWFFKSEPHTKQEAPVHPQQLRHQMSMSLTSRKEMASSTTTPIDIVASGSYVPQSHNHWWESIIPDSAMITSETGKLIGQPAARSLANNTGTGASMNHSALSCSTSFEPRRLVLNKIMGRITPNGSYSTMLIGGNGRKIIRHGYGSDFHTNVLSSRVSHAALREALESDMGGLK